jgi:glycopeptide antibiotics resistance protein
MQIDDVLTNTAGAMAGWLIWKIVTLLTGFLKSEFT